MSPVPLGEILVRQRIITPDELSHALLLQQEQPGKLLGEVLLELGISQRKLNKALDLYHKRKPLEELLVTEGLVAEEQLPALFEDLQRTKVPLGDLLVAKGWATEEQYLALAGKYYTLPTVSLGEVTPAEPLRNVLNEEFCKSHHLAVFANDAETTCVAIASPNTLVIEDLQRSWKASRELRFYLASSQQIEAYLVRLFRSNGAPRGEPRPSLRQPPPAAAEAPLETSAAAEGTRARRLLDQIIETAIQSSASDIHLEARPGGGAVKLRVDGILRPLPMPAEFDREYLSIVSRIKILTDSMKIDEKVTPQDGAFRGRYRLSERDKVVDFRVSTLCSNYGECATIRILDQDKARVTLKELGFSSPIYTALAGLLGRPEGMILVTGPTGSGKTTTLYAALNEIRDPSKKIITAEDPIEYTYEDMVQVQINRARRVEFSTLLRSFLRHDPDVILVGEIRDTETAYMAIKAVQTGHLLLSTLHTINATKSIGRLLELQIDPRMFLSYTTGILAQRLARASCPHCLTEYEPDPALVQRIFGERQVEFSFLRGRGCEACAGQGYKGRLAITELWVMGSEELSKLTDYQNEEQLRRNAIEHGLRTFYEDAVGKVRQGQTTLEEATRVIPNLDNDMQLLGERLEAVLDG